MTDWTQQQSKYGALVQPRSQSMTTAEPKRRGLGGFLTSLISEGGALGGGVKGAAIGSVAGPIGTLAGGAIGAGLGGFLGRLAENKIRDDEFKLGSAAKEGGVSAVFGASPIKALKGSLAATKAIAEGAGKTVAKEAAEQAIVKPGFLARIVGKGKGKLGQSAERLEARTLGLGVGEKIGGRQITPKETKRLLQVAINEGMPLGHPDTKAKFIGDKLDDIGKQIDKNVSKANRALTDKERLAVVNGLSDRVGSNVTLKNNPAALKELAEIQTSLSEVDDFKSLVKAKRDIQARMNFNRNSATPDPVKEVVYDYAQQTVNELLSGLNPKLKALNGRFGDLSSIQEGALNASKKLSNAGEAGGGGFWQRLLGGDTAQSIKSGTGRAGMAATGGDDAFKQSLALEVPGQGYKGFAGRLIAGKSLTSTGADPDDEQPVEDSLLDQPSSTLDEPFIPTESEPYNPYSPENAQESIKKILAQGGTLKDVSEYMGIVQGLAELAPQKEKLTATQATRAAAAQNAMNDIPLILENIESGKLGGAKALPGSGTQIGRKLLGTENLDAALFNIADNILRARSGAAAPEAEVKRFVELFLPSATDSQKAKKEKLARAVRELQGYINPQAAAEDTLDGLVAQGQGIAL